MVGATGVGSMIVNEVPEIKTNQEMRVSTSRIFEYNKTVEIGQELGRFEVI